MMASVSNDGGGRRRVLFFLGRDNRKVIRLGVVTKAAARTFADNLEKLIGAKITASTPANEVLEWVAALPDDMHGKLVEHGLANPRQSSAPAMGTLAAFIDEYLATRSDIKPNTRIGLGQARRNLAAFFGESRPLVSITEGDAEQYWRYLIGDKKAGGVGLALNTARRLCGRARQFFRFAVRKRIIPANPFAELKGLTVKPNEARQFFITRDMAAKVTKACPDAEWRLIFALSRFGGLRCPSEHLALKWADIDFGDKSNNIPGRIRVPSPKTEHLEGRAERFIPLFPELEKPLLDVQGEAIEGSEYVITRYRQPNQNLRTHFMRIVRRAGLEPWPKLFHNLRSSRQTELAETFPAHVVCKWLGNTEDVARAHYLQVTDEHFRQAVKAEPEQVAQNPAHQPCQTVSNGVKIENSEMQNRPENPSDSQPSKNGAWPLSESNRYALAGNGF
jgi:integrase